MLRDAKPLIPPRKHPTLFAILNQINPLNAKLNPTCHLLALLGAHLILHVSRIRVNFVHFLPTHSFKIRCTRTCAQIFHVTLPWSHRCLYCRILKLN